MPEYDKLVEVKTDIFGGGWKPAIFTRSEWGRMYLYYSDLFMFPWIW